MNTIKSKFEIQIRRVLKVFNQEELPKTYAIFYSVGFLLFAAPFTPLTRPLFVAITPLSLLFVFGILLFHHKEWNLKFAAFALFVMAASFAIEVVGVTHGYLFGEYNYLTALGPKIYDTPLIIAVNWLMLVYCSAGVMDFAVKKTGRLIDTPLKITGAALLMVGYDVIAELVAPSMQMWKFSSGYPPVENFITWFVMALFFHIILNALKIKTAAKLAFALFMSQLFFFIFIYIYLLVFP